MSTIASVVCSEVLRPLLGPTRWLLLAKQTTREPLSKQKMCVIIRGAIGGKTGKTTLLPKFCKIERGFGSGGAPLLGARAAPVAPLCIIDQIDYYVSCFCDLGSRLVLNTKIN